MAQEYGAKALISDEFVMSPEERMRYSLDSPSAPGALTTRQMTPIIKARINYAIANLTYGLADEAVGWLRELAKSSPKQAFQCYMELMEFTTPKQKASEITHNVNDSRPMRAMTIQELQSNLAERVVSDQ